MLTNTMTWMETLSMFGRIALAAVLSGAIGYEREHVQRNAGMRTHILVAVGAALVMCSGEFLMKKYAGSTSIDPARMGAQVISGIGFLGAGTIIKEGIPYVGLRPRQASGAFPALALRRAAAAIFWQSPSASW